MATEFKFLMQGTVELFVAEAGDEVSLQNLRGFNNNDNKSGVARERLQDALWLVYY